MTARKIILLCLAIIYLNPVKSTSSTKAETDQTTNEATTTEDATMTISSNTVTTNILSSTSPTATTTPTVTIPQSISTILSSTSEVTTTISTATDLTSSTREPMTTKDIITETSTTSPLETMTSETTATGTFSTSAYSTSSDTSHMTSNPGVTSTGPETSLSSSASTSSAESTNFLYTTTALETATSVPITTTEETTITSALTIIALETTTSDPITTIEEITTIASITTTEEITTSASITTTEEITTSDPITTTEETTTTSAHTTTAKETTTSAPITTTEEITTTSAHTTTAKETTTSTPITTTEEITTTSAHTTTAKETTTSANITTDEETTTSANITTAEATTTTSTHTTTAVTSTTNVYFITVKPTVALSFSTKYNDTRFNETLYMTSSPYFKAISEEYKEKLTSVYNKASGFHSLEITNFKRGSLIVEYKTKYELKGTNETILERDLNSMVFETLRNETDVDEEYLNTTFKSDIEKAKVQFRVAADQDPCQLDSVKEQCAGFPICNSSVTSTVTCSSPCHYLDCGSHGTCIQNAHNISKAHCSCSEDDRYIYGGERCHQRAEKLSLKSEYIIAIAGGVGGGLILILLIALISTCCCQRKRDKKKEMDYLPMKIFNEDDITTMQNHASKQDDGLKTRLKDGKDDRLDNFGSHDNPAMSGSENPSAVKTPESSDTSKSVQTTDGGGKHYAKRSAAADHYYFTIADKESEMTVYQPMGKYQFKESDIAQPPDQPRYSDEKTKPSYMSSDARTARQAGPTSSDFSRSSSRHADKARARDVHPPAGKWNLSTPYATQPQNPPPVDYDDDSPKSNFTHVYDYIPVERISIRRPQLLK